MRRTLDLLYALTAFGAAASLVTIALLILAQVVLRFFDTQLQSSDDMFKGLAPWMQKLPGRLLHTNVFGCGIFAAISGPSAATAATIGRMTIPELRKRGYDDFMNIGSLAGSGTLGLLIPPSIILIVWAILNPGKVPPPDAPMSFRQKLAASRQLIPIIGLILLVLGSIYGGYATPTESAVLGVVGSLALTVTTRTFSWSMFNASVMGAVRTNAMIGLILAGASFLTTAMGFTGLPRMLAEWVNTQGLSQIALIAALTVVYTPPVGFNLFALQGLTGRSMGYIALAALPFFVAMLAMIALIVAVPDLATWLPNQMLGQR